MTIICQYCKLLPCVFLGGYKHTTAGIKSRCNPVQCIMLTVCIVLGTGGQDSVALLGMLGKYLASGRFEGHDVGFKHERVHKLFLCIEWRMRRVWPCVQ